MSESLRDDVLSVNPGKVKGKGLRILTSSFAPKQLVLTLCKRASGDIFRRLCISINGFKLFVSSSMDFSPKPDELSDTDCVVSLWDKDCEIFFQLDTRKQFEIWQGALAEAIATANCEEAFTTYSPTGRLSFFRLNRALIISTELVKFDHPCMHRGRFLLTARRQLSELLLRLRDAGSAYVTPAEVSSLLKYCRGDPLLSKDSDVALLSACLAVLPTIASYAATTAVKISDERLDELMSAAALDELQDEQNGFFAYGSDGSPSSSCSPMSCEDSSTVHTADDMLDAKLAAMNGQSSAAPICLEATATLATPSRPSSDPSPSLELLQMQMEIQQQEDDFHLALAVQISESSTPLPAAEVFVHFTTTTTTTTPASAPTQTRAPSPISVTHGQLEQEQSEECRPIIKPSAASTTSHFEHEASRWTFPLTSTLAIVLVLALAMAFGYHTIPLGRIDATPRDAKTRMTRAPATVRETTYMFSPPPAAASSPLPSYNARSGHASAKKTKKPSLSTHNTRAPRAFTNAHAYTSHAAVKPSSQDYSNVLNRCSGAVHGFFRQFFGWFTSWLRPFEASPSTKKSTAFSWPTFVSERSEEDKWIDKMIVGQKLMNE